MKVVGRIRRDAAIYKLAPVMKKRGVGRPPEKGGRLPTPAEIAHSATRWQRRVVVTYGRKRVRLLHSF